MPVKLIQNLKRFYRHMMMSILLLSASGVTHAADPFADLDVDIPKLRMKAPAFTLTNIAGGKTSLADFAGKVVLLNFWATWCAPCRQEMPAMQRLWQRYQEQGFVVVAVAADKGDEKPIASFVKEIALSYPILLDQEGVVRNRYEVTVFPMSYLIGRDGKISGRVIGVREWDSGEAEAVITALLAKEQ